MPSRFTRHIVIVLVAVGILAAAALVAFRLWFPKTMTLSQAELAVEPARGPAATFLRVGSVSYAWGGTMTAFCDDGRVFVEHTDGSGNVGQVAPAAKIDDQSLAAVKKALGNVAFDYKEVFDTPYAFDAGGERLANYKGAEGQRLLFKNEYDALSDLSLLLASKAPENVVAPAKSDTDVDSSADVVPEATVGTLLPVGDPCLSADQPMTSVSYDQISSLIDLLAAAVAQRPACRLDLPMQTVQFGQEFCLPIVGYRANVKGEDVSLAATDIAKFCPWPIIDIEFVTGGGCRVTETESVSAFTLTTGGQDYRVRKDEIYELNRTPYVVTHDQESLFFSIKKAGSDCPQMTGDEARYCWIQAAEHLGDPALCDKIPADDPYRALSVAGCKTNLAQTKKMPSACAVIAETEDRDKCYESLAWDDPTLCAQVTKPERFCSCASVTDDDARRICQEKMIGKFVMDWAFYCPKIEATGSQCFYDSAKYPDGPPFCSWKDYCLYSLLRNGSSGKRCIDIVDAKLRADCQNIFSKK